MPETLIPAREGEGAIGGVSRAQASIDGCADRHGSDQIVLPWVSPSSYVPLRLPQLDAASANIADP